MFEWHPKQWFSLRSCPPALCRTCPVDVWTQIHGGRFERDTESVCRLCPAGSTQKVKSSFRLPVTEASALVLFPALIPTSASSRAGYKMGALVWNVNISGTTSIHSISSLECSTVLLLLDRWLGTRSKQRSHHSSVGSKKGIKVICIIGSENLKEERHFHSVRGSKLRQEAPKPGKKCPELQVTEQNNKWSSHIERKCFYKTWRTKCRSVPKDRRSRWGRSEERPRNTTSGPRRSSSLQENKGYSSNYICIYI